MPGNNNSGNGDETSARPGSWVRVSNNDRSVPMYQLSQDYRVRSEHIIRAALERSAIEVPGPSPEYRGIRITGSSQVRFSYRPQSPDPPDNYEYSFEDYNGETMMETSEKFITAFKDKFTTKRAWINWVQSKVDSGDAIRKKSEKEFHNAKDIHWPSNISGSLYRNPKVLIKLENKWPVLVDKEALCKVVEVRKTDLGGYCNLISFYWNPRDDEDYDEDAGEQACEPCWEMFPELVVNLYKKYPAVDRHSLPVNRFKKFFTKDSGYIWISKEYSTPVYEYNTHRVVSDPLYIREDGNVLYTSERVRNKQVYKSYDSNISHWLSPSAVSDTTYVEFIYKREHLAVKYEKFKPLLEYLYWVEKGGTGWSYPGGESFRFSEFLSRFRPKEMVDPDTAWSPCHSNEAGTYARYVQKSSSSPTLYRLTPGSVETIPIGFSRYVFREISSVVRAFKLNQTEASPDAKVHEYKMWNYSKNPLKMYNREHWSKFGMGPRETEGKQVTEKTPFFGVELEVTVHKEEFDSAIRKTYDYFEDASLVIKSDSSIEGRGFEMVTIPGTLEWHRNLWDKFFQTSREYLRSWDKSSNGIHIHISKKCMTVNQRHMFIHFFDKSENVMFLQNLAGRTMSQWAKAHFDKPITERPQEKYRACNDIHPDTLEIRIFRGTVNTVGFFKNLEFVAALHKFIMSINCVSLDESLLMFTDFIKFVCLDKDAYPALMKWLKHRGYVSKLTGKVNTKKCDEQINKTYSITKKNEEKTHPAPDEIPKATKQTLSWVRFSLQSMKTHAYVEQCVTKINREIQYTEAPLPLIEMSSVSNYEIVGDTESVVTSVRESLIGQSIIDYNMGHRCNDGNLRHLEQVFWTWLPSRNKWVIIATTARSDLRTLPIDDADKEFLLRIFSNSNDAVPQKRKDHSALYDLIEFNQREFSEQAKSEL